MISINQSSHAFFAVARLSARRKQDADLRSDSEENIHTPDLTRGSVSCVPTDIDLPERVFGDQASEVVNDAELYYRPPILPFAAYAACRLLDTWPDNPVGFSLSQNTGIAGICHFFTF